MMYIILYILLQYQCVVSSYNLCVVGAGGGLGRELVYQATQDRKQSVIALTTSLNIYLPYRGDSYNEKEEMLEYTSPLLDVDNYWTNIDYNYESLIICTGGSPFEMDYSDTLTKKILENLPDTCDDISIVSAYSVEDETLEKFSIPFQLMSNIYLKDVYRAKREQERILRLYNASQVRKKVFRPRALSYGFTIIPSTTRKDLAKEILDTI